MDFSDFEKELSLLSSISHSNIVHFYGASLKYPRIGILLEYCPGLDMKSYLSKPNVEISFDQKMKWLSQIFGAVLYLHNRNIIHRDLKSENLLLTKQNDCKLCDFGVSKFVESKKKV